MCTIAETRSGQCHSRSGEIALKSLSDGLTALLHNAGNAQRPKCAASRANPLDSPPSYAYHQFMTRHKNNIKVVSLSIRMLASYHKRLASEAAKRGFSLNAFLNLIVQQRYDCKRGKAKR